MRDGGSQPLVLFGRAQEVHDFGQVLLGLVDAGDVVKGRASGGIRRIQLGLAPAKTAKDAAGAAPSPLADIDERRDQQEHGTESEQESEQRRLARPGGGGGDGNVLLLQQGPQVVLGKEGPLGLEQRPALGPAGDRAFKFPLDGIALGGDALHVAGGDLLDEGGVGDRDAGWPTGNEGAEKVVEHQQRDHVDPEPATLPERPACR